MGMTANIRKARDAQAEHDRRVPVQLQIEEHPLLWATVEEIDEDMERWLWLLDGDGSLTFRES